MNVVSLAAGVAGAACVLAAYGCRDATAPDTAPLTFKLAANCAAFDADRSWTFYVDDLIAAEATMGSGTEVTIQVALGNRKVGWRWNRAGNPFTSSGPTFITAIAGGTNAVRINCP